MARTHALGFLIAKAFIDLGIGSEPESVPPSFRGIAATIESVREDAGHLFTAILNDNPFAAAARRGFLDALTRLDSELALAPAPEEAPARTGFPIPDFGERSPDLVEVRDLIDEVDRHLVGLLVQRHDLAKRAGHIKRRDGRPVRDPVREDDAARGARRVGARRRPRCRQHPEGVQGRSRPVSRAADQARYRCVIRRGSHPCTTSRCPTGTR